MIEASRNPAAGERSYSLFGLTLASDFAFASRLAAGRGPVDLRFSSSSRKPRAAPLGDPVYESPLVDEAGESRCRLYRSARGELLRFGEALDFYLRDDRIDCHVRDRESAHLVEVRLLGPVLAYWLERSEVCALHASAVVVDGRAAIFLAGHHGGKSGLAAAMMAGGAALLSDDLLPVEARGRRILARAGYPQMRLWPDQLARVVDDWEGLERVLPGLPKRRLPVGGDGFGSFHRGAVAPAAVYLPQRRPPGRVGGGVSIRQLSPRETLIELVRHSFSPFIVEAVGLQSDRLELLGRLASRVPARRLEYPSGMGLLPRVREAVLEDLGALRGARD